MKFRGIVLWFLLAGGCRGSGGLASDFREQNALDMPRVSLLGPVRNQWWLDEIRGRTTPPGEKPDLLPKSGIKLFDDGQRAIVLDTVLARIYEADSQNVVTLTSSTSNQIPSAYTRVATSIAGCPTWSLLGDGAVTGTWLRDDMLSSPLASPVPLLAQYESYAVGQFENGFRMIGWPCILQQQNRDATLQIVESLGQVEADDVRFGLELEFYFMPFDELESAVISWGGQFSTQEVAVQQCDLIEFRQEAFFNGKRVLHMYDTGTHSVYLQNHVGDSWEDETSETFSSEEDVHAYLNNLNLPSTFKRFYYAWTCRAGAPFLVNNHFPANTIEIYASQFEGRPTEVQYSFLLNDDIVTSTVDGQHYLQGEDLVSAVTRIEAQIAQKQIPTNPLIHYWGESIVMMTERDLSKGRDSSHLMWELALPPLHLTALHLSQVRALRRALKDARSQEPIGVRAGQAAGLHINVEIPRSIIEKGQAWEVARRYLVFWMRNRQSILDSYFPTAELSTDRKQYFGPIPEHLVNELETLDLSTVSLTEWLENNLAGTVEQIRNIDVNVQHAKAGRLEVRVSANDFTEPWHNVEARIRFCVGLMRYILRDLPIS